MDFDVTEEQAFHRGTAPGVAVLEPEHELAGQDDHARWPSEVVARMAALGLVGSLVATVGCGGPAPATPANIPAPEATHGASSGLAFEADIGALDEGKVSKAFERTAPEMLDCFKKGLDRLPYMAGQVRFALRIDKSGAARVAYLKESTLGDSSTENCMVAAAKKGSYPTPQGGREGLAETTLDFPPTGNERAPVEWSPSNLGSKLRAVKNRITACRARGTGPLRATLYVDTDGKPLAVGFASADENGAAAASCVVDGLKGLTLPSPGSYAAKVTIESD